MFAGCAEMDSGCGEVGLPLVGVVPICEQFSEQQSRAAATCGVALWAKAAFWQQSISPIAPPMLQDCSLECSGAPATALPATTNKITKDMSRVLIAIAHFMEDN